MADDTIYKRSNQGRKENTQASNALQLQFGDSSLDMKTKILIGRDPSCDVVLKDSLVSRKHCIIEKVGEIHYIRDLNSTNKTYVNKNPLLQGKPTRLQRGDVVNIGKTQFTIK